MEISDNELLTFISKNGFKFDYRIDPQVHCFRGTFLPERETALLTSKLDQFCGVQVYLYVIDNNDFGCGTSFRIELGLNSKGTEWCKIFGKSSPFCVSLDDAFNQAAMDILYRNMNKKVPRIAAFGARNT